MILIKSTVDLIMEILMETKEIVKSEVEDYAEFNLIRYAQVWEDADILLEALNVDENDNVLSIASARRKCIEHTS